MDRVIPASVRKVFAQEIRFEVNSRMGDDMRSQFLLTSGCAALEDQSGKVLRVVWPGELIPVQATALSGCVCLAAPADGIARAVADDPEFAAWLVDNCYARNRELEQRVEWFVNLRAEERILRVVVDLAQRALTTTGAAAIPLAQSQIAQLAGATRETASMLLYRLRKEGLLQYHRRWIEVPDPDRLMGFAVPAGLPRQGYSPKSQRVV